MAHFRVVCRVCGKQIANCRCAAPDKETRYETCAECAAKES